MLPCVLSSRYLFYSRKPRDVVNSTISKDNDQVALLETDCRDSAGYFIRTLAIAAVSTSSSSSILQVLGQPIQFTDEMKIKNITFPRGTPLRNFEKCTAYVPHPLARQNSVVALEGHTYKSGIHLPFDNNITEHKDNDFTKINGFSFYRNIFDLFTIHGGIHRTSLEFKTGLNGYWYPGFVNFENGGNIKLIQSTVIPYYPHIGKSNK